MSTDTYNIAETSIQNLRATHVGLLEARLVEMALSAQEGRLTNSGALLVYTGVHTGRSPNDKFVVRSAPQTNEIWWGKVNQPMEEGNFDRLLVKMLAYLQGREVHVQELAAGADPKHRIGIRLITENAWAALFARDLFIREFDAGQLNSTDGFTVLHCPDFQADPRTDGTVSSTFIILNLEKRLVLIGGTSYAGEIKKSIFSVMNYILPRKKVLSMHCSANVGKAGDTALFFGLSGTGKTTLSSDPERSLIGDDEHGWSDEGIFNIEGGCYAKAIRLDPKLEPLIWQATHRFGAVLENVAIELDTRKLDFDSEAITENTRVAYPLHFIPGYVESGQGGHPSNIFFLSADAFGVLPPIARLTPEQAMFYFLSGYTAKLAGTEKGLGAEPQATFSTCFGAPFLPLQPGVYAALLGEKIKQHKAAVWLVNTGWTGGAYGTGKRMSLPHTRALIRAALNGSLVNVPFMREPYFGLEIPHEVAGVPSDTLNPVLTWNDQSAYEIAARGLAERFRKNFEQFENLVPPEVTRSGPK